DQPGHDLIAGLVVGYAVDGGKHDAGIAGDGCLDRLGGEVLPVDAEPVGVAAREVEVAVVVEVAEIAGPVPAETQRAFIGFRVVVVTLEGSGASGVHDLPDAP